MAKDSGVHAFSGRHSALLFDFLALRSKKRDRLTLLHRSIYTFRFCRSRDDLAGPDATDDREINYTEVKNGFTKSAAYLNKRVRQRGTTREI